MIKNVAGEELGNVAEFYEQIAKKGLEIYKWVREYKKTKEANNLVQSLIDYSNTRPFFFQGNITDLSYFWNHKELPVKEIIELEAELQKNVLSVLESAQTKGYVTYDKNGETFNITPKGNEFIYTPNFIESVVEKNQEQFRTIVAGVNEELRNRQMAPEQEFKIHEFCVEDDISKKEVTENLNLKKNQLSNEAIARRKQFSQLANKPLKQAEATVSKTIEKGIEKSASAGATGGISLAYEVGKEILDVGIKPIKQSLYIKK